MINCRETPAAPRWDRSQEESAGIPATLLGRDASVQRVWAHIVKALSQLFPRIALLYGEPEGDYE